VAWLGARACDVEASHLLKQDLRRTHWIRRVHNDDIKAVLLSFLDVLDAISDVDCHSWVAEADCHLREELLCNLWHHPVMHLIQPLQLELQIEGSSGFMQ
jgi:hypothetical protein